jgi:hypothetical protein
MLRICRQWCSWQVFVRFYVGEHAFLAGPCGEGRQFRKEVGGSITRFLNCVRVVMYPCVLEFSRL